MEWTIWFSGFFIHPHLSHGNSRWKSRPNAQGFLAGFWHWQTVCLFLKSGASGTSKIELARRLLFHVTAAWRIHQKYSKLSKRRTSLESQSHKWTKIPNFILYSKRIVPCKNTDKEVLNGHTAGFRPRMPVRNTLQDSSIHSGRGEKSLVLIYRRATCVPIWEQKSPATEAMSVFTAGTPAKLTRVQLHRHAGGKDCDVSCCRRRYVLICRRSIAGSTGGYVAGTLAVYENQAKGLSVHLREEWSLYVSGKLSTYPSPKSEYFCPKWKVSVNVGLGEG